MDLQEQKALLSELERLRVESIKWKERYGYLYITIMDLYPDCLPKNFYNWYNESQTYETEIKSRKL